MTRNIGGLFATLNITLLGSTMPSIKALSIDCHYSVCPYAECRGAVCVKPAYIDTFVGTFKDKN